MAVRGRKPKPTAVKKLQGNPGKRPLPKHEARPKTMLPPVPRSIKNDVEAVREWRRAGKLLEKQGLITHLDQALFTAYCLAWSRLLDANAKLKTFGPVIKTPGGTLVQSPYLQIVNKCTEQLARLGVEFGMSASSRTRIDPDTPPPDDEFARRFLTPRSKDR